MVLTNRDRDRTDSYRVFDCNCDFDFGTGPGGLRFAGPAYGLRSAHLCRVLADAAGRPHLTPHENRPIFRNRR
jgi:hypothetical protein